MLRVRFPLLLLVFFSTLTNQAQNFGGVPSNIKWRQINNDTARIIFPAGLEKEAAQVAFLVGTISRTTLSTLGPQQRKINIVFQNQTTIANGYVQLAPYRSEFQLTPEQNSFEVGSLPWNKQLAIHEYRHVEQYNNYRVGLSKVLYYLFGESGQELGNSLSVPNWFWEGDAVYQETLISKQGRGRLPFFFNGYRSLWAGQKNYSWMKLRNGSFQDYLPDHYPLGYMQVAYGREKYGADFWGKVTLDAASFKGFFYPMQKAIKKYSGLSFEEFRSNALNEFREQVKPQTLTDSFALYASQEKHFVSDQEFPQIVDAGHLIYAKTTYKKVHSLVMLDLRTHREKKLKTMYLSLDNYFSYRNHKVTYATYQPDLRWSWRDYNLITVLDLNLGTQHIISTKSKYFAPDISPDGNHIVAVWQGVDGKSELHLLNAQTGAVEKKVPNDEHFIYTYPKFFNDQQVVAAVRNQKGEMAMALISIGSGQAEWLTPFSMGPIGFPSVQQDTIYFSAAQKGQDGLFAVVNKKIYRLNHPLLESSLGHYQSNSTNGILTWTNFTAVGFRLSVEKNSSISWEEYPLENWTQELGSQHIQSLKKGAIDLPDSISGLNYPVSKYSSNYRLLNFHSWRPYITDPNYMLAVVSENVLGTMQSELSVNYNRNEHSTQLGTAAVYGAFFPWFNAGVNYTFDRNALFRDQTVYWNEAEGRVGTVLPLNLSKGLWLTRLQVAANLIYNQRFYQGVYKDSFDSRGFAYTNPSLLFTNQTQIAKKQIYPSWAQAVFFLYDQTVTTFPSHQLLGTGNFYFPGLSRTHSLVINLSFQQRDSLNHVRFTNYFPFSRGYTAENFYQMYSLGGNYHFPIVYPDWGFANMLYFLRLRANVFYDYTQVKDYYPNGAPFNGLYRSFGTEIYLDTKWWNQLQISFGIRYSRLIDPDFGGRGPNQWELILPVNILSQ